MQVSDLLRQKGTEVITIPGNAKAREAMGKLVENRIGAIIVMDADGTPQGIVTERDFLWLSFAQGDAFKELPVSEIMTKKLIICLLTDSLDYAMTVMTTNRIRHLPILDGPRLAGIISIGDVVKANLSETLATNRYLQDYVYGHYTV